jgi:hypothetical protein
MSENFEAVKDVTTTSFGLIIAYVLPGLVGLYTLTLWSNSAKKIANTFYSAQSDVGLSLLVLAAAVVVGLQVNALRFLCYERLLCRAAKIAPEKFKELASTDKLTIFITILEENFRYHQFFGSMTLLLPVLSAGLLKYVNTNVSSFWFIFVTISFTLLLALLMFLSYEIQAEIAGLRLFLWCYDSIRRLLTWRLNKNRVQIILWSTIAFLTLIYLLWLWLYHGISNRASVIFFVLGFAIIEVATGAAAIVALRRYVERTTNMLS